MNTAAAPISAAGYAPVTTTALDEARMPPAVRDGSPQVKQAYASAQSFEEMLLQQLSQSMMQTAGLTGEGEGEGESGEESGGSAGGNLYASFLPQTLTEGVMHSGGLGLATQLLDAIDPSAATSLASSAGAAAGGTVVGGTAPAAAGTAPAADAIATAHATPAVSSASLTTTGGLLA